MNASVPPQIPERVQTSQMDIGGVQVTIVKKPDKAPIFRLPENVSVDSLTNEQRQTLLRYINIASSCSQEEGNSKDALEAQKLSIYSRQQELLRKNSLSNLSNEQLLALSASSRLAQSQISSSAQQQQQSHQQRFKSTQPLPPQLKLNPSSLNSSLSAPDAVQSSSSPLTPIKPLSSDYARSHIPILPNRPIRTPTLPLLRQDIHPPTHPAPYYNLQRPHSLYSHPQATSHPSYAQPIAISQSASQDQSLKTTRKYNKTGKYSKKRKLLSMPSLSSQHSTIHPSIMSSLNKPFTDSKTSTGIQGIPEHSHSSLSATQPETMESSTMQPSKSFQTLQNVPSKISTPLQQNMQTVNNTMPQGLRFTKPSIQEIKHHSEITAKISSAIKADTLLIQNPDSRTPFQSIEDAIKRLLPYHLYQYPDEDLYPGGVQTDQENILTNETTVAPPRNNIEKFKVLSDATICSLHDRSFMLVERYKNILRENAKKERDQFLDVCAGRLCLEDERQKVSELKEEAQRLSNALNSIMCGNFRGPETTRLLLSHPLPASGYVSLSSIYNKPSPGAHVDGIRPTESP